MAERYSQHAFIPPPGATEIILIRHGASADAIPGERFDLIVADPADEDAYLPALTALDYMLATREPHWYEHRCLWNPGHTVNLHVFGPDCDEHLRHLILRDWLREHPRRLAAVTLDEAFAAAQTYLAPSRLVTVVLGKADGVAKPLEALGAVELA